MLHNRIWRSVNRRIGTVLNNDDVELDIEFDADFVDAG